MVLCAHAFINVIQNVSEIMRRIDRVGTTAICDPLIILSNVYIIILKFLYYRQRSSCMYASNIY